MKTYRVIVVVIINFSSIADGRKSLRKCLSIASFSRGGSSSADNSGLGQVIRISIPEEKHFHSSTSTSTSTKTVLPLTLSPLSSSSSSSSSSKEEDELSLTSWLTKNRPKIALLLPLHGAILFRGFTIPSPSSFSTVVIDGLKYDEHPYIGGNAVRTLIAPRVFTSNESPPDKVIPWHHELAQNVEFPRKILFYCQTPSKKGGETPIVLSALVSDVIQEKYPGLWERFKREGVRYTRVISEYDDSNSAVGRGWRSTYNVTSRGDAESVMKRTDVEFEWLDNGDLKTTSCRMDAIKVFDGKFVFFNQVIAAYTGWNDERNVAEKSICFGISNDYLPQAEMRDVVRMTEELSVAFKWEQGDVLLIDNRLCMHSRRTFIRPRVVLASLCK